MSELGINATVGNDTVFMRNVGPQVREVALGETLTVGSAGSITCAGGTVSGNAVVFDSPGRYTVSHALGSFSVLAYEPTALALVPTRQSSGAIGRDRSEHEKRLILRSLSTHSTWNGTALDLTHFHLQQFGA